jgi:transcriptional regulator with XRE-family HTH domain
MKGDELRRLRTQMGLTQAALAERVGVTPNAVALWERGERNIGEPAARLIRLLATMKAKGKRKGR